MTVWWKTALQLPVWAGEVGIAHPQQILLHLDGVFPECCTVTFALLQPAGIYTWCLLHIWLLHTGRVVKRSWSFVIPTSYVNMWWKQDRKAFLPKVLISVTHIAGNSSLPSTNATWHLKRPDSQPGMFSTHPEPCSSSRLEAFHSDPCNSHTDKNIFQRSFPISKILNCPSLSTTPQLPTAVLLMVSKGHN